MFRFFRSNPDNPWLEKDRQDQRKVIVTIVLFAVALLGGIGFLAYAILHG